jgi:hypothetical protein
VEPFEPQHPPCESQPPPRRSSRLARTIPLQPTPLEQEEGEHSDGDPVYQNPEMPSESCDDTYVEHVEFEDVGNGISDEGNDNAPLDPSSTQHLFREGTWSQSSNTFSPEPSPYLGGPSRLKHEYTRMPTFLHLFGLFWTHTVLNRICVETNRYAQEDEGGKPKGGHDWYDVREGELRAFMGVRLWMGMRKQPNIKTFWIGDDDLFYCPKISGLFTRKRFETLSKCLHLTNMEDGMSDRSSPNYDKVGQCRWLIDVIQRACKSAWQLGAYCTIDELMVRYKGSYCPIRQYLPMKPEKWGIKIWCLADSITKYVYDFDVYMGKSNVATEGPTLPRGGGNLAQGVVLKLMDGLENEGRTVVMDNYFTSIELFQKLHVRGIYATGTIRANRMGLLEILADISTLNRSQQGSLDWRMHDSRTSVAWRDKKMVRLLSTHTRPVVVEGEERPTVPRRNGAIREAIPTSPVHLEYTTYMRGVDVADQLRSNYSCQVRTHKWWHRIFYFLLDMSVVNMYLMYLECWKKFPIGT